MMARKDHLMLAALLGSGRLTEQEERVFKHMQWQLERHAHNRLSRAQRQWVENRYLAYELDADEPAENLVSSGQVPKTTTATLGCEMMPRPQKPPGH